jgi:MraZ protein
MFRGNLPATIDPKGRLKIPTSFRNLIEEKHGRRLFVTSMDGNSVLIYPFPIWEDKEIKYAPYDTEPVVQKFIELTNYWGRDTEIDDQGRILIPHHLRESAQIEGEVAVMGRLNHLEVCQDAKYRKEKIEGQRFSTEEWRALSALVSQGGMVINPAVNAPACVVRFQRMPSKNIVAIPGQKYP